MSFSKWAWPSKDRDRNRDRPTRRKLDLDELRRAPIDVILKLDSETLSQLPINLLERLPPEGLRRLPSHVLIRLSPESLACLPPEDLRRLPIDKLVTLPPSTINRYLAAAPPGYIERMPPEVLAHLESLPSYVLNALSNSTLCHLRPSILAHLSPERLPFLPVDILANLPWTTIVNLPSETLSRLPTSTLLTLPPETLANLDSDALSRLPAHVRQRIPATSTQSVGLQSTTTQSQTELPSVSRPVEAESETGHAHQVPREQTEQATGVAKRAMTKQIGRSKSVNLLSDSMAARQADQRTSENVNRPDPTDLRTARPPRSDSPRPPRSDSVGRAPHKRASYRHLRHPSLESASQIGKNSASEKVNGGQSSDVRVVSPLGAVIAEARGLRRDSEGGRGRSSSLRRSSPQLDATQVSLASLPNESTVPSETRPGGPSDSAERQSPTVDMAQGEKRVPSSGSQTSIARRGSLRQVQTDNQNKQIPVKEKQDMTHRLVLPDQRAALSERPRGTRYEPPRYQVPTDAEIQLHKSLDERDRLIVELQAALDHETASATEFKTCFEEATLLFEQQKNNYDRELADLRNMLEGEKAKKEQTVRLLHEQLAEQEHGHQKRTKQLEAELQVQNSSWDEKLQEVRQKSHQELAKAMEYYEVEMDRQKHVHLDQMASLQREISKREEQHAGNLKNLRQEHKTQLDALTGKLETQRAAHDQQVDILTGQLQDQDGDYRKQIAQLNEKHAHEIQKLRGSHQVETAAINDKSNVYAESLRRQYEDQVRLQRDHFQRETQLLKDRHHNALQQQALEHSRMLDSLRAESGDFVRKASDDKLNAMFGQLKIAVEVVSEPFNLGRIAIQPGSTLDPAGFSQREKGMQRHLLRSLIWAKIAHGFFSAPFGFGVFGDGSGRQMLLELLLQWRRLVEPEIDNGIERLREAPDVLPHIHEMCRDRETNRWRSATFQSIMAIVTARTRAPSGSETGKPDMRNQYAANRAKVQREIVAVLNEATNSRVAIEIEEKVGEITSLAGELALEMGVHRAYLGLEFPNCGDQVVIGRDFVDCEDGDPARGILAEVDLVVCPRFFKIGDGRSDMTASKSIFRGEVYPKRE